MARTKHTIGSLFARLLAPLTSAVEAETGKRLTVPQWGTVARKTLAAGLRMLAKVVDVKGEAKVAEAVAEVAPVVEMPATVEAVPVVETVAVVMPTRREKRLAKNEVTRQANKARLAELEKVEREPMMTMVMGPMGPTVFGTKPVASAGRTTAKPKTPAKGTGKPAKGKEKPKAAKAQPKPKTAAKGKGAKKAAA